jgi:hypothetical protein
MDDAYSAMTQLAAKEAAGQRCSTGSGAGSRVSVSLSTPARERGNPVFSVMASDIIYCGANLIHWMERDPIDGKKRSRTDIQGRERPWPPIKEIQFWGQAVRYKQDKNSIVCRQIAAAIAKRKR